MGTVEGDAIPDHSTSVERITQYTFDRAALHEISASGAVSEVIASAGNCCRVKMFEVVLIHDVFDNPVFRFIDHKRFAVACRLVSKTWRCLIAVLQGLFLHAAQDFTG